MSKRLLVTTALHETWDFERPILFLSESCKIFHERKKWVSLDYTTMDHRWDNREKFYLDYENLNLVYEKVLLSVSSKLNGIHGTSYNSEYWRIIIGPWLFFFTHVVFERWCQIKRAEESDNVLETIILESMHETFVPKDMTDFAQLVNTDSWNHFIYSHILQHFSKIPVRKQGINKRVISSIPQVGRGSKVNKVINWIFDKYNRKKRVILVDLSLQKKHLLRLFFKYGYLINVPINDNIQEISINNKLRDWELKIKDVNDFEKCLISLLPLQIPTTYLEGYTSIFEVAQKLFNHKAPAVIVTQYVFYNEKLKFYIAKMKNEGSKLIILQHGGTYGLARKFVNQDHEFKIADIFLSWGWSTEINCKVIPGSMMIMNNHVARKIYDQPHILWVIGGELRYSYKLWSQTIGAQWDKYINEQIDFYSSLTRKLQKATLVRLYNGSGWNEKERFLAVFPDISITESKEKLRDLSTKSRVVVLTYNATTFLETLSLNIPTIIYWDTGQWELSDEGIPYFDELKSVGIFHETPVSAAAKIEDVWDDIEKWWMQDELQTVVRKFVHNYARTSDNDIDDFMKKIQVTIEDLQFIQ